MEKPQKKENKAIRGINGKYRLFDFDKGFNQGLEDMEAYILERLEKLKLPEFTLKTSDVFNKRIDKLIEEVKNNA